MDKNPNLIVVLGGGLKKDENGWRTTRYDERGDNFGVQGDRLRVDSTYLFYEDLSKKNKNILLVSSGGRGQLKNIPDSPTVASVIKKELVALGIPEEKILLEENSDNTYQQLQQLIPIIQKHSVENCLIISNGWHLPRIKAMIEYGKELDYLKVLLSKGDIRLLSAEDLLISYQPDQWRKTIEKAQESDSMKKRIALEQDGVKQIKAGEYKFILI